MRASRALVSSPLSRLHPFFVFISTILVLILIIIIAAIVIVIIIVVGGIKRHSQHISRCSPRRPGISIFHTIATLNCLSGLLLLLYLQLLLLGGQQFRMAHSATSRLVRETSRGDRNRLAHCHTRITCFQHVTHSSDRFDQQRRLVPQLLVECSQLANQLRCCVHCLLQRRKVFGTSLQIRMHARLLVQ